MRIRSVIVSSALLAVVATGCGHARAKPTASATHVSSASVSAAGTPSATPEAAVTAYLTVAHADAAAILNACAVDEKATRFNFSASVDRLQVMLLTSSMAPTTSPFYRDLNRATETSHILTQVRSLSYSLLSTEKVDADLIRADGTKATRFAGQVDPKGLARLTVVEIRFPLASMLTNKRNLDNSLEVARIYGADESVERVALVSVGSATYEVGFTLFRYGSSWKVSDQISQLAGTSTYGAATPMSRADFDAEVNK